MGFNPTGSTDLGSAHGKIELDAHGVNAAMQQARRDFRSGLQSMAQDVQRVGQQMNTLGQQMTVMTAPLALIGGAGVRAVANYEETLNEISARTGVVGEDLQAIGMFAQDMGAQTVFSTDQVLNAFLQMLTAGASVEEAYAALPSVLNAAAAGNIDLGNAADYVTNIMSMYKLPMEEAAAVTDSLAQAAASSPTNMDEMAQAFTAVGPVAAQFGLDVNETSAILAIFAQNGKRGAEAGTQLKSMLLNMTRDVPEVQEAWARLGTSMYDSEGNMRELDHVLADINTALATMTPEEQNEILMTLGGSYGLVGMNALLASDGIGAMESTMAGQASAADVAQQRMNTFNQKVESLKGSLQALAIAGFEPLLEPMKAALDQAIAFVNKLTEWVRANPELTTQIIQFGSALVALGPILMIVGQAVTLIGVGLGVLLSPIGLVIAAVVALGAAYATNFMGLRDMVQGQVIPALQALWDRAAPYLESLRAWFMDTALPTVIAYVQTTVLPALQTFFNYLKGMWEDVSPSLTLLWDWFTQTALPGVVMYLQNVAYPMLLDIFNFMAGVWELVSPALTMLWDWFTQTALPAVVDFITGPVTDAITTFYYFLAGTWALVRPALDELKDWFMDTGGPGVMAFWNNLKAVVRGVVNVIVREVQRLIEWLERIPSVQELQNRAGAGVSGTFGIGRGLATGQFTAGDVFRAARAEFRDDGGAGIAGVPYAIGRGAGVEAFVTPQARGEFVSNIDKLLGAVADREGGGGVTIQNLTVNANTEEGGQAAARGFYDELVRRGLA